MDINIQANEVYACSHQGRHRVVARNLMSLTAAELDDMKLDLMTMSPPCQPFTRLGLRKDLDDARCSSFEHLMSILPQLKSPPPALMLENVKGFEGSKAFQLAVATLQEVGYAWCHFLLSPNQFGVPNSRPRYYLVAHRPGLVAFDQIHRSEPADPFKDIPVLDEGRWTLKPIISLGLPRTIEGYLDKVVDDSCHLTDNMFSRSQFKVYDLVQPSSTTSNCFTRSYGHRMKSSGSILYPVEDRTLLDDTYQLARRLTEGDDQHDIDTRLAELMSRLRLRLFSPTEVARLMCLDRLTFPVKYTRRQCYRLMGNSVNVAIVRHLLRFLLQSC